MIFAPQSTQKIILVLMFVTLVAFTIGSLPLKADNILDTSLYTELDEHQFDYYR